MEWRVYEQTGESNLCVKMKAVEVLVKLYFNIDLSNKEILNIRLL